jgi:hypothetical protein
MNSRFISPKGELIVLLIETLTFLKYNMHMIRAFKPGFHRNRKTDEHR